MSAHTPGPWQWVEGMLISGETNEYPYLTELQIVLCPENAISDSDNWALKLGAIGRPENPEAAEANARLIAAAPELLAALREVEAHHVELNRLKGRDESRSYTLRTVRAAIARAEGFADARRL